MAKTYVQPGNTLTHTAAAAISSGDIVPMNDIVGVALGDIANGSDGEVMVTGVFTVTKVAGTAFAQGDKLNWDDSNGYFTKSTTAAAGDVTSAGVAAAAALSAATVCNILLTPGTGTGS